MSWLGKSKGNRLGYAIFINLLKTWGARPAYFLLRFVAAYYFLFSRESSRNILYFFRKRLGFPFFKSIGKLYQNYYWFGQTLIDRVIIMSGLKNKLSFKFEGEEYLHRMVSGGKGGLMLSAHLGNWEIAGYLLRRLNTKINIVMFDGEDRGLKEYLDKSTGSHNAHIILLKEDLSHIYEIIEALGNNEFVVMHADRFLYGNKTLENLFLGETARFPAGPFVLASKLNVPVSFVYALKDTHIHYHFYATPGVIYQNREKEDTPARILKDFVTSLEKMVKQYPEQWYNYYPFWDKTETGPHYLTHTAEPEESGIPRLKLS
jgi:predicted LPLAT superfamily acyltransferase